MNGEVREMMKIRNLLSTQNTKGNVHWSSKVLWIVAIMAVSSLSISYGISPSISHKVNNIVLTLLHLDFWIIKIIIGHWFIITLIQFLTRHRFSVQNHHSKLVVYFHPATSLTPRRIVRNQTLVDIFLLILDWLVYYLFILTITLLIKKAAEAIGREGKLLWE